MGEEFTKVADTKDIKPSQMKAVEAGGESICLINIDGKYYGIGNICTHVGGPLDQGTLKVTKLNVLGTVRNSILEPVNQRSLQQEAQFQRTR